MNETRIGELRRAKGWTQERLAAESGITTRTIQRLEAGSDASLETIGLIADALGVPVGELFIHVETKTFEDSVDGLDARKRAQQAKRDGIAQGIGYAFGGIGILVTLGTVVLVPTGALSALGWLGWLIIPAYWGAGGALVNGVFSAVVDPRLDAKYPLSVRSPINWGQPGTERS
ncbi:MAG TPA: helix-turn-helix transcriptional regulator [Plantibacter sp.]|uniref:helix-turn-helix domain-containing protein n=1 Tax=unclassified Plantibacter TaxID=2624265 RepID=UPI002CC403CD|nr:helix-turn-helix transcriptional regulator [Plantibacter sp.]